GHVVRRIRAYGLGESLLAQMLSDLDWQNGSVKIGTRASVESLTVILRAPATAEGLAQLERIQAHICAVLGERVFGFEDDSLPAVTGRLLREAGLAVATAESCTGGLVAKRLTDVPGSSDYFRGGVVAYSNDVKTAVLGVDPSLLETKGAVSAEVAAVMAEAAARLLGSQCAVSTTGIAGPGGATKEKPVGLVYIGSVVDGVTQVERLQLFGQREQVRERAALTALDILRRRLLARTKQTVPPRHNP
ncbi:MAG: nicotinamide-nucleotide amidohydrolase family protein, partial [Thermoleophilia bacterium]|nr:nicotinamide-nucleotide amidohydrolase family protein [Thermoleophilia bacterium]